MNVSGDALFLEQEFHVFLHQRMKRMISFILYVTSSVILITICLICWAKISVCYSFVCHLWTGKCTFLDSLFRLFANYAILNIVMVKINKFLLMPFTKNFKVVLWSKFCIPFLGVVYCASIWMAAWTKCVVFLKLSSVKVIIKFST